MKTTFAGTHKLAPVLPGLPKVLVVLCFAVLPRDLEVMVLCSCWLWCQLKDCENVRAFSTQVVLQLAARLCRQCFIQTLHFTLRSCFQDVSFSDSCSEISR